MASGPVPPSSNSIDWKNHPVVIAALASAGTLALTLTIGKEVILPTYLQSYSNEIADLKKTAAVHEAELKTLRGEKTQLIVEKSSLDQRLSTSQKKLFESEKANLFLGSTGYPVGLAAVRVGDPASKVEAIFPQQAVDKADSEYYIVTGQNSVFNRIVYYFEGNGREKTVSHISFNADYNSSFHREFLQHKLLDSFGTPKLWRRKEFFSWSTSSRTVVFKSSDSNYILMPAGSSPGYWPDS